MFYFVTDTIERNYAQIEKEYPTIVTYMNKWHQYLHGESNITVHMDHQPLETINQEASEQGSM